MTALWFSPPAKALDANANPMSGAIWYFYQTGTLSAQAVFADAGLAVSLGVTVTADDNGKFANIFLDASKLYRAILKSADGATTIHDIDPVNPGYLGPDSVYSCEVTGTGNVSLTSGSLTAIGWNVETYDPMGMHSTSASTDEVAILVAGTYSIRGKVTFASNSTGYRQVQLQKNGSALVTNAFPATNGETTVATIDEQVVLTAGDGLRLLAGQNSGGGLNYQKADSYFRVKLLRSA